MSVQAGKPFELVAGDVVLDFINTLDDRFRDSSSEGGPEELLISYDDLLRFLTQSALLSENKARKLKRLPATHSEREEVLQQVKDLRETLAAFAYATLDNRKIADENLSALDTAFKQASSHRKLAIVEDSLAWKWTGQSRNIASPLWLLAQSASDLLLSQRISQLRACASGTCRWLFLDTSKNHTRRWCDMKICGNRMKARRFQARQSTP